MRVFQRSSGGDAVQSSPRALPRACARPVGPAEARPGRGTEVERARARLRRRGRALRFAQHELLVRGAPAPAHLEVEVTRDALAPQEEGVAEPASSHEESHPRATRGERARVQGRGDGEARESHRDGQPQRDRTPHRGIAQEQRENQEQHQARRSDEPFPRRRATREEPRRAGCRCRTARGRRRPPSTVPPAHPRTRPGHGERGPCPRSSSAESRSGAGGTRSSARRPVPRLDRATWRRTGCPLPSRNARPRPIPCSEEDHARQREDPENGDQDRHHVAHHERARAALQAGAPTARPGRRRRASPSPPDTRCTWTGRPRERTSRSAPSRR